MLEAFKISYSHKKFLILKEIDFTINYGELVVIVGPNGAGKSTLLSVLANELEAQQETLLFKTKTFKEWNSKELPLHKAKFSQHYSDDMSLSVTEVVMMGRYPYFNSNPNTSDIEAVNKTFEKTDIVHLKNRDFNTLSGGEKQRVHLARVLTQLDNTIEQKILFMDEPLNNLDVLHQHRILQTVKEFTNQGNTVVLVLHDLNLAAQFADKVVLLQKGKLIHHGKPEDVFTREIISKVYNFPCTICQNPVNKNPLIIFGT